MTVAVAVPYVEGDYSIERCAQITFHQQRNDKTVVNSALSSFPFLALL